LIRPESKPLRKRVGLPSSTKTGANTLPVSRKSDYRIGTVVVLAFTFGLLFPEAPALVLVGYGSWVSITELIIAWLLLIVNFFVGSIIASKLGMKGGRAHQKDIAETSYGEILTLA